LYRGDCLRYSRSLTLFTEQAYIDRNRVSEALKILLRVLVLESTSKEAREEISRIVKGPGGLGILYQELGDAAKSGAALAFMATLVRFQPTNACMRLL
jgi:hypothetical protein